MDNMEKPAIVAGGFDDELTKDVATELLKPIADAVTPPKGEPVTFLRRPYVTWEVGANEYKLRLTTGTIMQLEQKFNTSLLNAVMDEGIPPLSTIITILQAALQKFQHGITSYKTGELLDTYFESGKTQIDLLRETIYPLMGDAGFFTAAQMDMLTKEMENVDTDL